MFLHAIVIFCVILSFTTSQEASTGTSMPNESGNALISYSCDQSGYNEYLANWSVDEKASSRDSFSVEYQDQAILLRTVEEFMNGIEKTSTRWSLHIMLIGVLMSLPSLSYFSLFDDSFYHVNELSIHNVPFTNGIYYANQFSFNDLTDSNITYDSVSSVLKNLIASRLHNQMPFYVCC